CRWPRLACETRRPTTSPEEADGRAQERPEEVGKSARVRPRPAGGRRGTPLGGERRQGQRQGVRLPRHERRQPPLRGDGEADGRDGARPRPDLPRRRARRVRPGPVRLGPGAVGAEGSPVRGGALRLGGGELPHGRAEAPGGAPGRRLSWTRAHTPAYSV